MYPRGLAYQEVVPPLYEWKRREESRIAVKLKEGLWMWYDENASREEENFNVYATALAKNMKTIFGRVLFSDATNVNDMVLAPAPLSQNNIEILIAFVKYAHQAIKGEPYVKADTSPAAF